jgi:hypothetical protein
VQAQLDLAAASLAALDVAAATTILDAVDLPGDFDGDGDADGGDFLLWQRELGQTGLYPLATRQADGNADGVVDEADLELWKRQVAKQAAPAGDGGAGAGAGVPEPSALALTVAWLALAARTHGARAPSLP